MTPSPGEPLLLNARFWNCVQLPSDLAFSWAVLSSRLRFVPVVAACYRSHGASHSKEVAPRAVRFANLKVRFSHLPTQAQNHLKLQPPWRIIRHELSRAAPSLVSRSAQDRHFDVQLLLSAGWFFRKSVTSGIPDAGGGAVFPDIPEWTLSIGGWTNWPPAG